jgi:hypothetical protein
VAGGWSAVPGAVRGRRLRLQRPATGLRPVDSREGDCPYLKALSR